MNSQRRRLSSTAPVPERPATKSSKSGMQNVFWTSTARRQRRKESSAAGPIPCFSAHASASRARSSYGTRQTSPTWLGSKCFGSCSSRIAPISLFLTTKQLEEPVDSYTPALFCSSALQISKNSKNRNPSFREPLEPKTEFPRTHLLDSSCLPFRDLMYKPSNNTPRDPTRVIF